MNNTNSIIRLSFLFVVFCSLFVTSVILQGDQNKKLQSQLDSLKSSNDSLRLEVKSLEMYMFDDLD